jgi:hypothetical protein
MQHKMLNQQTNVKFASTILVQMGQIGNINHASISIALVATIWNDHHKHFNCFSCYHLERPSQACHPGKELEQPMAKTCGLSILEFFQYPQLDICRTFL